MLKAFILVLLLITFSDQVTARQKFPVGIDSKRIIGDTVKIKTNKKFYDPKIASRRSAIFPGLGQIYNNSWWKVPILYAGFGLNIHFIGVNNKNYLVYKVKAEELIEIQNTLGLTSTQSNELRVARRQADYWRENRDLLYITLLGVYALNIIEATIDAHLKGFNVDDNLALNLKPKIGVISNGSPYVGVSFTFAISR